MMVGIVVSRNKVEIICLKKMLEEDVTFIQFSRKRRGVGITPDVKDRVWILFTEYNLIWCSIMKGLFSNPRSVRVASKQFFFHLFLLSSKMCALSVLYILY